MLWNIGISFIHSFIYPSIHSFIHSFIQRWSSSVKTANRLNTLTVSAKKFQCNVKALNLGLQAGVQGNGWDSKTIRNLTYTSGDMGISLVVSRLGVTRLKKIRLVYFPPSQTCLREEGGRGSVKDCTCCSYLRWKKFLFTFETVILIGDFNCIK